MYKYETHMHTREASACAHSTGAEMAEKYKAEGYTGIIVTDHFFNGNSAVPRNLPWEERIELYCKGYESAKTRGDQIGLDVFFGFEYGNGGSDSHNTGDKWFGGGVLSERKFTSALDYAAAVADRKVICIE